MPLARIVHMLVDEGVLGSESSIARVLWRKTAWLLILRALECFSLFVFGSVQVGKCKASHWVAGSALCLGHEEKAERCSRSAIFYP